MFFAYLFVQREPSELALHGFWLVLHTIRRMVARDTFTSVTLEEFKDTGRKRTTSRRMSTTRAARGFTRTCIARKAISVTRAIGIAAHIVPWHRIR